MVGSSTREDKKRDLPAQVPMVSAVKKRGGGENWGTVGKEETSGKVYRGNGYYMNLST